MDHITAVLRVTMLKTSLKQRKYCSKQPGIRKHLKSGLFEGQISNGPVFKWRDFSYGLCNHSKFRLFCPDFKWFLTKWLQFVGISNGWASGFQIPFKIWTNCNSTSFQPFEIQTSPDFRSHCM